MNGQLIKNFVLDTLQRYGWQYGLRIALILGLLIFGKLVLKKVIHRVLCVARKRGKESPEFSRRMETLCNVASNAGKAVIYGFAVLMLLKLFGVDIAPILTGAGILGLVVGFGSQTLVKDLVAGIFILIEDQYGVGDTVKIGGIEGKVIKITIRSTVLKKDDGHIFYISNGSISNVENISKSTAKKV